MIELNSITKDQATAIARAAGWAGDDARTPKHEILQYLAELTPQALTEAAAKAGHSAASAAAQATLAIAQAAQPEPAPVRIPAAAADLDDDDAATAAEIARILAQRKAKIDPEELRRIVRDEIAAHVPRSIVFHDSTGPVAKLDGEHTHPLFEKVLRLVRAGFNVLLVGPAGAGKTHLAHQIAKALGREFGTLHCTAGASESQLTGYLLPIRAGGAFEFVPAPFALMYGNGNGVFLLDEIDAADPNMLLVINGALSNGALHIPQRFEAPEIKRGENLGIMAAANTFGQGADFIFAGRNQLDGATLDRFYVVCIDYDAGYEARLCGIEYSPPAAWQAAPEATAQEISQLGNWIMNLRNRAAAARLRRVISTRTIQKGIAARIAGIPTEEVKADILSGWTADEKTKAGV
jgi:cobaltochelatase CobS